MKNARKMFVSLMVAALLVSGTVAGCGEPKSQAERVYRQAQELESESMLTEAEEEYERAHDLFQKEGRDADAMRARSAAQSVLLVRESFPHSEADIRKELSEMYPGVPGERMEGWIDGGELEHMTWDGEVHYFAQAAENMATREFDLAYRDTEKTEMLAGLIRTMMDSCREGGAPWQPYSNPLTWIGTQAVKVPRSELPANGLARLWFPLPLEMGGVQNGVSLLSATPDTWVKQPPSIEGPVSSVYFEVPLEELEGDLEIEVKFQFTHYQTNFKVDPSNVGEYDRSSALYRRYTRSYGNIHISDEIRRTARKVAGAEKNPYLVARRLYDYILEEIKYSYMPHMAAWPRGETESEYVHRLKRGDCGAQGMYFAAMCRSLGIPARCTGGWQLFSGQFAGHFWAEFYLPNYGWIPVDPTAADIADWTDRISDDERAEFKEFYFGNQDPLRCNVQFDVDEETTPPLDGEILVPLAVQDPVGTCRTMKEPLSILLSEYHTKEAELISGRSPVAISGRMH